MSKTNNETPATDTPEPTADTSTPTPAPPAIPLKPLVQYGATYVELHLVPGGRQILVSGKTRALKLDRDPALELNDPNVQLVLAMAAGPDLVAALSSANIATDSPLAHALDKATGG